jgi:hypothetical protein
MKWELEEKLFNRYPKIFAQHALPMTETAMNWGIECGDGWYALIYTLCAQLQHWTDKNGAPQVEATQVKEKYGGLRFYVASANDIQQGMIEMAEAMSDRLCEVCGRPGEQIDAGWLVTRCEAHRTFRER